jgi:4-hydroxy-3-methylbut-2-en-1-yl diphosphate reductase
VLTSGASCPDTLVDRVLVKMIGFFKDSKSMEEVLAEY